MNLPKKLKILKENITNTIKVNFLFQLVIYVIIFIIVANKDSNLEEYKTVTFSEEKNKSFVTKVSIPDFDAKP